MTSSIDAGRVGRPHGLDGSFHVTRPLEGAFALGMTVTVAGEDFTLDRVAGTVAAPILRLKGCTTREAAEALRGSDIQVPRDTAPPLDEDEYWADDLVGLRVVDGETAVGDVERVLSYPSCEVLVVGERLIPLVDDAVRSVDVKGGVVDVDLGFLGEG